MLLMHQVAIYGDGSSVISASATASMHASCLILIIMIMITSPCFMLLGYITLHSFIDKRWRSDYQMINQIIR